MSLSTSTTIAPPLPGIRLPRAAAALPPAAKAKLARLIEAAEQAGDTSQAAARRAMQAGEEVGRATSTHDLLLRDLGNAGQHADDRVKAAKAAVVEAETARRRRQELANDAAAAAAPVRQLVAELIGYIEAHHSGVSAAPAVALKLGAVAPATRLHETRLELQRMQARVAEIRAAPPTDAEVLEAVGAQVAVLASRVRPNVNDGRREIVWPLTQTTTWADGRPAGTAQVVDVAGLLSWLDPAAMTKRLVADVIEARKVAGIAAGLPRAERAVELGSLGAEILNLERVEESLVTLMEERGSPLLRRADADPRAVLGLLGPTPSAA